MNAPSVPTRLLPPLRERLTRDRHPNLGRVSLYHDLAAVRDRLLTEGVIDVFDITPRADQAGRFEDLQMVGHRGLADVPHLRHQVPDTQLTAAEQSHDPLPRRVRQCFAKNKWV